MDPIPIGYSFLLEIQSVSGVIYAFPPGSTLTWKSSDTKVATVVGGGSPARVTAVGKGNATITCEMFLNTATPGTIVLRESVTVTQPDLFKLVVVAG